MDRRDVIKSLAALPFFTLKIPGLKGEVQAMELGLPKGQLVIFANPQSFDFDALSEIEVEKDSPLATALFLPVRPRVGQTIQDEVSIYRIEHRD